MSLAIIFTERKHRRDSVQPALYLSIWIITNLRGVCQLLYLMMKCYKMFFAFSVFQISKRTWSLPLWDKLKSKERFCEMSTDDIPQKIALRTGSISWTLRALCHPHCNYCRMCSLFSAVPTVPRSWIRKLSFRSRRLCLWGPLSWSLVLQLVPPQQASSESETKRSPSKLQPLSLQTFLPTLGASPSYRILRDADRSRFSHPMLAAGLLRSIYLEWPSCSIQASELS